MGFLDDVASAISGGAATVGRSMDAARLRKQLDELAESRRDLAAQLGEALLETVKNDPDLYKQHHETIDVMERLDAQRAAILGEIVAAETVAAREREANTIFDCPKCGRRVFGSQSFCTGCGTPTSVIKEAMRDAGDTVAGKEIISCPWCGARMEEGDLYCMECGNRKS